MGTEKHSLASKRRWRKVAKEERKERMKALSNSAWAKLDAKARRRRALKAARTRAANRLKNNLQE